MLYSCRIIVNVVEWTWWDWSLILRTSLPSVLCFIYRSKYTSGSV